MDRERLVETTDSNPVINIIYSFIIEILNDPSLDKRMTYHNDYDEINIYVAPKSGTKIEKICSIDFDRLLLIDPDDFVHNVEMNLRYRGDVLIKWYI